MKNKKRICWLTANYMLQVDLPVLANLCKDFDIDWYLEGNQNSSTGKLAMEYADKNRINLKLINSKSWIFHPVSSYIYQNKIIKNLATFDYSIYYFDISTFPWLLFIIMRHIPLNRIVLAMHHGKPHKGMRFKLLYFPFLKLLNRQNCYLQYFSNTQAEAFKGENINKRFIIPLALNNFGELISSPDKDKVTFLFFGNIIPSKNLSLLISAGNCLWEKYPNKFKIKIVGHCKNWESNYSHQIKHPEAFELDIRRVDEHEIPNIFGESNYLVLPYNSVTQSGPLRIAYGYNIPVITSDLDGFKESVIDGISGLIFENDNVDSLLNVMEDVIINHPMTYENLKIKQKKYVDSELSIDYVCDQYSKMFNEIIERQ